MIPALRLLPPARRAEERVLHNPAVPASVQNATLTHLLAAVAQVGAIGARPVVFVDVDLTALLPTRRTIAALVLLGDRFGIEEFRTPHLLVDQHGRHLLPGYTEEAWSAFVRKTGIHDRYTHLDWRAPTPDDPFARPGGILYASFRRAFWHEDLRTDEVTPGLADFIALVEERGGSLRLVSGRAGPPEDTLRALVRGGIADPPLELGTRRSGLRVPRPGVRDTDADTKFVRTREAEGNGETVVAIIDDRASNRRAVASACSNPELLSIALAAPGFSHAQDAEDPGNPYRLSTFAFVTPFAVE